MSTARSGRAGFPIIGTHQIHPAHSAGQASAYHVILDTLEGLRHAHAWPKLHPEPA